MNEAARTQNGYSSQAGRENAAQRATQIHDLVTKLLNKLAIAQAQARREAVLHERAEETKAAASARISNGTERTEQEDEDPEHDIEAEMEYAIATAHVEFEMELDSFSREVGERAAAAREVAEMAYRKGYGALEAEAELFQDVLLERIVGGVVAAAAAHEPRQLFPFRPQMVGLNETVAQHTEDDERHQALIDRAFKLAEPDKSAFEELFCEQAVALLPARGKSEGKWPEGLLSAAGDIYDQWIKLQVRLVGSHQLGRRAVVDVCRQR